MMTFPLLPSDEGAEEASAMVGGVWWVVSCVWTYMYYIPMLQTPAERLRFKVKALLEKAATGMITMGNGLLSYNLTSSLSLSPSLPLSLSTSFSFK